jgi:putative nucleotidyltransferase-like protein
MTDASPIRANLDEEAQRLLAELDRHGIPARLIGGMAIRLLAGARLHPAFDRPVQDLDFVTRRGNQRELEAIFAEAGYTAAREFNALNGARRLLFYDEPHGRQIDIFVETFSMCHELPLTERLETRAQTLPAAEVLMTKLQIVELTAKDRGDLYALLLSHELGDGEGDLTIDVGRIVGLTANDWGLHRTFELNLAQLELGLAEPPLTDAERAAIAGRLAAMGEAMEAAPKTRRWRLRARIGERKRWYEEPEEVQR